MKRILFVTCLLVLLTGFLPAPIVRPVVAGVPSSFGFNLLGPQSAMAVSGSFAGDTLRTTGSGSFDTSSGLIVAGGSFTHFKVNGTVFARGTWQAISFVSFTLFGGANPGEQGGKLIFNATFSPDDGSPVNLPVTVVCRIDAPSGFSEQEGVRVGDFTNVTRGATLFHANQ